LCPSWQAVFLLCPVRGAHTLNLLVGVAFSFEGSIVLVEVLGACSGKSKQWAYRSAIVMQQSNGAGSAPACSHLCYYVTATIQKAW
jgi:hypothetical protein